MNSSLDLLIQWSLLFGGIIFLIYMAIVIKEEKSSYEDEAVKVPFKNFSILIPSWWGILKQEENFHEYQRTDTRYEWFARYEYINEEVDQLEKKLEAYLDLEHIYFDEEETVFETNPEHFIRNSEITDLVEQAIRVEGTATEKINNRIYLDIIFMKLKGENGFYRFQSHSSVLNGAVEGPYFEETINQMTLQK